MCICGDSRPRLSSSEAPFFSLCSPVPSVLRVLDLLFLKQIFKRRPRIIRPQRSRSRSLLLPRHPNLVVRTLIPQILLRHPLLHRLHAFKPAPRIEISTLLARMQLKPALRTLSLAGRPLQHRPTLRAPRHRPRPRQIHRSRSERVVPLRSRRRRARPARLLSRPLALVVAIAILIPMLPIFRHKLLPSTRPVWSTRPPPLRKWH